MNTSLPSVAVVWIDRDHVRIVSFPRDRSLDQEFRDDLQSDGQLFFKVDEHLRRVSKILIVGPGVSKYQLYAYLRKTSPTVARAVVSCEMMDQPHEFQIRAYAERYLGVKPST